MAERVSLLRTRTKFPTGSIGPRNVSPSNVMVLLVVPGKTIDDTPKRWDFPVTIDWNARVAGDEQDKKKVSNRRSPLSLCSTEIITLQ